MAVSHISATIAACYVIGSIDRFCTVAEVVPVLVSDLDFYVL